MPAEATATDRAGDPADEAARLRAFGTAHRASLEADEARHTIILGVLDSPPPGLRTWSLGTGGQCAIQYPGKPVVLGDLDQTRCGRLAEALLCNDHSGVVGPDRTAEWFVERAIQTGATFGTPVPQMIHALSGPPTYPGAGGTARAVGADDAPRLLEWLTAFTAEAVPHEGPPDPQRTAIAAGSGRYLFWTVNDEPVAMAGLVRTTRRAAAIAAVYTPPPLRGRGYAGSVTAAVVELAYSRGKSIACLYTDLRNPASNRCYAKIGFNPVCESWFYPRTNCGT